MFPFDLLIQVSATQLSLFLYIPSVFMVNDRTCEDAMHTSSPGSPTPLSSNFGSPDGSILDLDRVGVRSAGSIEERIEAILARQFSQIEASLASIHMLDQGFTRFDNGILSLAQSEATITNKIANVEQVVHCLAARVVALETSAASASSISGSARSWPSPGRVDGSTAIGSHGPGSSDDNRNTRRRLDTFSNQDDENARRAVLIQFPCEQCHAGRSTWLNKFFATTNIAAHNMPTIHCKTGSVSARIVFETRSKCQDFVARFKDDVLPYTVDSPYCRTSATILVCQSKSPEDREIDGYGKFWLPN